jgi:predicted membrane-bound spermidine synthase
VNRLTSQLAVLLFGSGACALVYQVAWFREFRLVFGASTAATGAVLALFVAGLGAGGLWLGQRADRHPRPVRLYALLELGIAISAALTPVLLFVTRRAYVGLGGTPVLGLVAGTLLRLLLSALVLSVPTFLMGGTLPAVARAVQANDDLGRRRIGWLYGVNTLGAVTGCVAANFFLLEMLGTRRTLLSACAVNALVALGAFWLSRSAVIGSAAIAPPALNGRTPGEHSSVLRDGTIGPDSALPITRFVVFAAAAAGFAFFVMEIVWYRMLGPLLGGTVFTFGLILAVALLGVGLGGAFYGVLEKGRRPSLASFAVTSVLEALCMAVPYALGDRVATLALGLRSLEILGFPGLALGWSLVAMLVVLPAACVAGAQFPMLIALLGEGAHGVGRQTGLAYAANTAGGILGSLLGGFVLLPTVGALGCWRGVVALLVVLGLAAAALAARSGRIGSRLALAAGLASIALLLLRATGPTALFRHSPIGVGRVPVDTVSSPNGWRSWTEAEQRGIVWEADGVESAVALSNRAGLAFVVNGKVDGHIRADAPTQVMSGMVGAILHPDPKTALVIGLGTGSSAGWLGAIPELSRVDVVELEPAILRVAKDCAVVNHDVLDNPKVHVAIGDAREVLLTTRSKYDLIFSEPSNPYRAGIASLFTVEYYRSVESRLEQGGLFLQWVQAYDVDSRTVKKIYATLGAVFPAVETWELGANDLLLVGSREPLALDAAALRAKVSRQPYKTALATTWRAIDLEGFLAHFIAGPAMTRAIAEEEPSLNTDDRTLVEFAFARSANHRGGFDSVEVMATARARGEARPVVHGEVAWDRVDDGRITFRTSEAESGPPPPDLRPAQRVRAAAQAQYLAGQWASVVEIWQSQGREPTDPTELAVVAEAMAELGNEGALRYAAELRELEPAEADAITARLLARQGKLEEAMSALEAAFARHRIDPWPMPVIMRHALELAADLATHDAALAARAYAALRQPFAGDLQQEMRTDAMLVAAGQLPLETACVEALSGLEPHVPWRLSVLSWRSRCYEAHKPVWAARAARDLDQYLRGEATPFGVGLTNVELR